ncbi:MAG: hypothetical protein JWP60_4169, partial [Ramlibacter sp.]|nr:hypothetical protein [Ramlibacter sp.]
MARTPGLKLALLGLAVLLAHWLGLAWFGRQAEAISALRTFVPPMYTRLLKPSAPPPVVAVAGAPAATPRPRVAVRAITPASAPRPVHRKKKPQPPPEAQVATPAEPVPQIPPDSEQVAQAPEAAASDAQPPASSPEPA